MSEIRKLLLEGGSVTQRIRKKYRRKLFLGLDKHLAKITVMKHV